MRLFHPSSSRRWAEGIELIVLSSLGLLVNSASRRGSSHRQDGASRGCRG